MICWICIVVAEVVVGLGGSIGMRILTCLSPTDSIDRAPLYCQDVANEPPEFRNPSKSTLILSSASTPSYSALYMHEQNLLFTSLHTHYLAVTVCLDSDRTHNLA